MKAISDTLTIKAFHINQVEFGNATSILNRCLTVNDRLKEDAIKGRSEYIKSIALKVIHKEERTVFVNSIMDFSPIATKASGEIGVGVTHVLEGVCVMLTGVDEQGLQVAEFGSSEGILAEQVKFGKAGTPKDTDIILQVDVTLWKGKGTERCAILEVHKACDRIVQEIRDALKKLNGRYCDEKHEYLNSMSKNRKKIVIIKQVAGQGAMYDTGLFPKEPCGVEGCRSIIDMGNMPILLTPNEYRDGALRAMH